MDIRSTAPRQAGRRLLFGLLLNLLFSAALQTAPADELTVEEFSGAVKLKMNDRWQDPEAGMQVVLPATVSTGEDGSIELAQDGSVFSVASNTALEFFAGEDGTLVKRIVQSKGSAFYDISNREHLKLRVETPWLAAVIKGTEFNVTVETASASVALFEGLLRIEAPDTGEAISLDAGFIARRGAGDPRITVIPMDGGEPVSGTRSGVTPDARGGNGDGTSSRGGQPDVTGTDDAGEGGEDAPSRDDAGSGPESGGDEPEDQGLPGIPLIEDELQAVIETGEVQSDVGLPVGKDPLALEATVGTDVGSLEADVDADIGNGEVGADIGVDASVGDVVDAGLDADLGSGEIGTDIGVDAGVGDVVDAGIDTGLDADFGTGEVGADVGVDASVGDLADAGVDAGLDADLGTGEVGADVGVDVSAGDLVDAGIDTGVDADLGTGEVGADVGVDASAGDLVDADVDAGLDTDLGTGEVGADLGADVAIGDLDAGVDAGVDADLGSGDVGVEAGVGDVGLDAGLDDGGLDIGLDLGELGGSTNLVDDLLGGGETDTGTDETEEEEEEEDLLPDLGGLLRL